MSDLITVADMRIRRGLCAGRLVGAAETAPVLRLEAGDVSMPAAQVSRGAEGWQFEVQLPAELLSEGVQSVLILNADTEAQIGQITLSLGEALADDLRADVAQLRAELDLLKAAFRRELRGAGRARL